MENTLEHTTPAIDFERPPLRPNQRNPKLDIRLAKRLAKLTLQQRLIYLSCVRVK